MAEQHIRVEAVAITVDGQDGGGYTTTYPNLEALKEAEFPLDNFDSEEEREEKYQSALNGDNPYEDGEIDTDASFQIVLREDGTAELLGSMTVSWGQ